MIKQRSQNNKRLPRIIKFLLWIVSKNERIIASKIETLKMQHQIIHLVKSEQSYIREISNRNYSGRYRGTRNNQFQLTMPGDSAEKNQTSRTDHNNLTAEVGIHSEKKNSAFKNKLCRRLLNRKVLIKDLGRRIGQNQEIITKIREDNKNSIFKVAKQRGIFRYERNRLKSKAQLLEQRNAKLRTGIEELREKVSVLKTSAPLLRCLKFASLCKELVETVKADIYVAHDVLPLVAAHNLRESSGGKVFCNAIEIPSYRCRAVNVSWEPEVLTTIESITENCLRKCDNLITIGPTLAKKLNHYGPPVTILENYRYSEKIELSSLLRQWCGLTSNEVLLLSISTVATGFENVLRALKILPENIHIAVVGKFFPADYEQTVLGLIDEYKLEKRVHIFDFLPYETLTTISSGADAGLIIRDPKILNNYVSLPNRIFDYMFSGLPVCSPEIPDITTMLDHYDFGVTTEGLSPEAWANAIRKVLERKDAMSENAIKASQKLTWESKEQDILEIFNGAGSVTFLGTGNLVANNRTQRIARTLADHGVKVKICCVSTEEYEPSHENISYHTFPNVFI